MTAYIISLQLQANRTTRCTSRAVVLYVGNTATIVHNAVAG
jgi:hypothetical protein